MSCEQDCHCFLCRELDGFLPSNSCGMSSSTDNFILKRPMNADYVAGHKMMKPQPLFKHRQSKPFQKKENQKSSMESDRNFALGISDIKMPVIEYWKNKASAAKKAEYKDRADERWSPLCKSEWDNGDKIQVRVTQENEEARLGVKLWKPCKLLWNINGQSVRIENSMLVDDIAAVEGWVAEPREDLLDVKNVTSEGEVAVVFKKNEKAHPAGTQQAYGVSKDKLGTSSSAEVWEGAAKGYGAMWQIFPFLSCCLLVVWY